MLHVGEKQIVEMELVDAAVRQAALSNAVGALCQDVVAAVPIQLKLNVIDDAVAEHQVIDARTKGGELAVREHRAEPRVAVLLELLGLRVREG